MELTLKYDDRHADRHEHGHQDQVGVPENIIDDGLLTPRSGDSKPSAYDAKE